MSLKEELRFSHPIKGRAHEAVLNIIYTGKLLDKEAYRILRPHGLTDSQFNVMMLLKYQTEYGESDQTRLGDMLLVNRSNMTGLVDRMEQAGWVERVADANDRRVNRVRLTKAGNALLETAEVVYNESIEKIMQQISDEDAKRICRLLERVRKGL
ncbi:MAG: MarR family transcriptional regulator [Candidatus Hinthialibacter antarcticus]|nr:MarR family transcriptional regulator [Candidatus Hinthialibacter antarcticus]